VSDKLLAEERKKKKKKNNNHETAKMLKKNEKQKNYDTGKEHHPHIVERDKPKISKSVGQTFPQLPWKQKRGI
jgi:hypothetical protein